MEPVILARSLLRGDRVASQKLRSVGPMQYYVWLLRHMCRANRMSPALARQVTDHYQQVIAILKAGVWFSRPQFRRPVAKEGLGE